MSIVNLAQLDYYREHVQLRILKWFVLDNAWIKNVRKGTRGSKLKSNWVSVTT